MNKSSLYFILFIASLLFSCSKNSSSTPVPLREYPVQYATDINDIEDYLKTYYIKVIENPGVFDDMDVIIAPIPLGGTQTSIWDQKQYPLKSKDVLLNDITYKLYYISLRTGSGESPCNADAVLPSYKGSFLNRINRDSINSQVTQTVFEENITPNSFFNLPSTIYGWGEIFPLFKTGTASESAAGDGTIVYNNFGAGIVFIPSGLGYYASGSGAIPSYSPLVFSFKLYAIKRLDQDGDGIFSYQEDINRDGFVRLSENLPTDVTNPDDTDGDGLADFVDIDDDGDLISTRKEIIDPKTNLKYDFDKIPSCDGDVSVSNRKKKYLDKNCH